MLAVIVGLLVLAVPALGTAPPAHACSCPVGSTDLRQARPGDVLLKGVVLARDEVSFGEAAWTVQVSRVLRGQATAIQPVVAGTESASCGTMLALGVTYLVDAVPDRERPGVLRTGLCSATTPVTYLDPTTRRDVMGLGPGHPPATAPPAPVTGPVRSDRVVVLVAGAATGAVLAGAVVVLRHRRRRR